MGTRADFYVGRGADARWLGSIAWDGYPGGIDPAIFTAGAEDVYRERVADFLAREDGTTPDMGWPWPWGDSTTTDYAYAFDAGRVYGSCFGHAWFAVDPNADAFGEPEDDNGSKTAEFPDMSAVKRGSLDRSGFIIISSRGGGAS